MKCVLLAGLLLISLVTADNDSEKRGVLRRTTRQLIVGKNFMSLSEHDIMTTCKQNGKSIGYQNEVKAAFEDMRTCTSKKPVFVGPKQEYLDFLVNCTTDMFKKINKCLKPDQQYFADTMLDLIKSSHSFLYDNKDKLKDPKIPACIGKISRPEVGKAFSDCIEEKSKDEEIAHSRSEFCRKFTTVATCYPGTYEKFCPEAPQAVTFLRDWTRALVQPCET